MVPRNYAPKRYFRGVFYLIERIDLKMFLLEYVIVFVVIYLFYYFLSIKNNLKYNKDKMPVELLYLKKIYKVSVNKENYSSFVKASAVINSFIISTIYIILIYLVKGWILRIILGIILLILLIIICYGVLARYYLWKEGR